VFEILKGWYTFFDQCWTIDAAWCRACSGLSVGDTQPRRENSKLSSAVGEVELVAYVGLCREPTDCRQKSHVLKARRHDGRMQRMTFARIWNNGNIYHQIGFQCILQSNTYRQTDIQGRQDRMVKACSLRIVLYVEFVGELLVSRSYYGNPCLMCCGTTIAFHPNLLDY
jgi:hypothetical protein